jgi:hypothetical protein
VIGGVTSTQNGHQSSRRSLAVQKHDLTVTEWTPLLLLLSVAVSGFGGVNHS